MHKMNGLRNIYFIPPSPFSDRYRAQEASEEETDRVTLWINVKGSVMFHNDSVPEGIKIT